MKLGAFLAILALHLAVVQGENIHARHPTKMSKRQNAISIPALTGITATMPTGVPPNYVGVHKPGEKGRVAGSPVLPVPKLISDWPTQDQLADMTTPEVATWMKELEGVHIPDIRPTKDSVCGSDPEAAANAAKNGWWTCGGYTRPTDIIKCPTKQDWGMSYDDGPSPWTPMLLEKLKQINVTSTLFVVGSRAIQYPDILRDAYMAGHEISVHTWSHRPLTTLSTQQIVAEFGYTRAAIKSAIGVTPTTMRPPRGDIDDRVRAIALAMGLVPIIWTNEGGQSYDTFDWQIPDPSTKATGATQFEKFKVILDAGSTKLSTGFVTLQHDLYESTVKLAVGYYLDAAVSHTPKYNIQPIGQCNKIPETNLYFETNQNKTFPYSNRTYDINGNGKDKIGGAGVSNTVSMTFMFAVGAFGLALSL